MNKLLPILENADWMKSWRFEPSTGIFYWIMVVSFAILIIAIFVLIIWLIVYFIIKRNKRIKNLEKMVNEIKAE